MSLSRRCALRATAGKHSGLRCAWRSCGVGARGRQRTVVARCRYQSALSRTCPTGWTYRLMCHVGAYCGRYTIVVDDDIDVSNLEEVIWALITRSDPATSIDIIHNSWSTPLDHRI